MDAASWVGEQRGAPPVLGKGTRSPALCCWFPDYFWLNTYPLPPRMHCLELIKTVVNLEP